MKNKTIGIIGYGSIAKLHIEIISKYFSYFNIIIFREKNFNKVDSEFKNKITQDNILNIKKYYLDYVFITNPSSFHFQNLYDNYKRKVDFFIEKPIFNKIHNIQKIIKYFANNNNKLQVGYVFRFDEVVNNFKKLITNQLINKNTYVKIVCKTNLNKWRKRNNYKNNTSLNNNLGGGVLLELSHEIDYCIYLFGVPNKVFSILNNSKYFINSDVEDMANIFFFYSSGLIINIEIEFNSHNEHRFCKIYSNKIFLNMDLIKRKISIRKNSKNKMIKNFNTKLKDAYINQLKSFFNKKKDIEKIKKFTLDSLEVVKLIDAIKKSNETKKIINV